MALAVIGFAIAVILAVIKVVRMGIADRKAAERIDKLLAGFREDDRLRMIRFQEIQKSSPEGAMYRADGFNEYHSTRDCEDVRPEDGWSPVSEWQALLHRKIPCHKCVRRIVFTKPRLSIVNFFHNRKDCVDLESCEHIEEKPIAEVCSSGFMQCPACALPKPQDGQYK